MHALLHWHLSRSCNIKLKKKRKSTKKKTRKLLIYEWKFSKTKSHVVEKGQVKHIPLCLFSLSGNFFYIFQRTHCITSFFIYYTITTYFQCIWISSDCAISNLKSLVISIRNSSDIFNTTNESTWKFEHHHDSFKIITFFKQLAVCMSKTNNTLWPFTRQPTHQVKFVDCTVYYYSSCVRYKREKDNSN